MGNPPREMEGVAAGAEPTNPFGSDGTRHRSLRDLKSIFTLNTKKYTKATRKDLKAKTFEFVTVKINSLQVHFQ